MGRVTARCVLHNMCRALTTRNSRQVVSSSRVPLPKRWQKYPLSDIEALSGLRTHSPRLTSALLILLGSVLVSFLCNCFLPTHDAVTIHHSASALQGICALLAVLGLAFNRVVALNGCPPSSSRRKCTPTPRNPASHGRRTSLNKSLNVTDARCPICARRVQRIVRALSPARSPDGADGASRRCGRAGLVPARNARTHGVLERRGTGGRIDNSTNMVDGVPGVLSQGAGFTPRCGRCAGTSRRGRCCFLDGPWARTAGTGTAHRPAADCGARGAGSSLSGRRPHFAPVAQRRRSISAISQRPGVAAAISALAPRQALLRGRLPNAARCLQRSETNVCAGAR